MGRIPEDIIRIIRDRVDVVGLVGRFVALKPSGRNHKGLCPFHSEKTPSFVVNPERGTFKCFGCDAGGTAISFLMRIENLTFPEAVRQLGAELGIEVPDDAPGERGIDAATIDRFGIGFAPDAWEHLSRALRERGIPASVAEQAGLVAERRTGG